MEQQETPPRVPVESTRDRSQEARPKNAAPAKTPADKEDHPFRDLVSVLAIVLAALQLIPAFALPRSQWPVLILGVSLLGACTFAFLQVWKADRDARRRFLPALIVLFLAAIGTGYKFYSLRGEVLALERKVQEITCEGPLRTYLDAVVDEHKAQWDGQFESRYARPTLYLLTESGSEEQSPSKMQDQLLLWRTGTEGVSAEFRGIAGLVGESMPGKQADRKTVARGIVNYVERPIADSDLLNKKTGEGEAVLARTLVLGDPASGKSAMLDRLDMIQARRARGDTAEPVPALISLEALEEATPAAILARVKERLGEAAPQVLGTRKVVLMLDGLDEAGDPAKTAAAIAELADSDTWDRIIVSARLRNYAHEIHGDDSALWRHNFRTVILYGLDQTAIEKQILTRATTEARQRMFQKLADSKARPAWLQFLRLPLNYELISSLMSETEADLLPRGQTEIIEGFLDKRFKHRRISDADGEHCKEVLTVVAKNLLAGGAATRSRGRDTELGPSSTKLVMPRNTGLGSDRCLHDTRSA